MEVRRGEKIEDGLRCDERYVQQNIPTHAKSGHYMQLW